MRALINITIERDGMEAGIYYAKQTLRVYRAAARYRNPETGRRHFCHLMPFRPHFVRSIIEIREFLKSII